MENHPLYLVFILPVLPVRDPGAFTYRHTFATSCYTRLRSLQTTLPGR